ncbi:DUF4019 domain-containing protein [Luteibacter anthropi]|uniref:DUF4019 domain-containing protein n=1 Tax=Luteibacter anthropi TaxID=564369 RepID=A0A7X5UE20_9GAMM|nr:DUF4019 domain-containing protein [Luteibacter anthropi]NII08789.1 DUF4019 domain-containing protein [Luteibacter anthropi]URX63195.1 DUF4019 domain-containing protein [Luteibacter anthropi]
MSVSSFHGARIATVTPSAAAIGALLTVAGTPRLGPQPNSLDNAVSGATHWVRLADGRRSDAMWLEAGALMQKRVPRGEWQRYLRRIRIDRGPLQSREWFEVTRVRDPVGLPEGDYLNVIFIAHFVHATQYETVSLAPGAQGWLPVGYVVRPVQREA